MNFYDVIFAQQKTKTDSKYFSEISDAINVLAGTETTYAPSEMASAILDAIPEETASGAVAYITAAAPINAEDVTANIDLVQDLHGYDSPWPGGGGKNLVGLNTSPAGNITYTYVTALEQTDDKVVLTSTKIADYAFMNLFYNLKAGTYTASIKTLTDDPEYNPSIAIYKQPGNVLILRGLTQNNPSTFTLTEDALINFRFFVMSNDITRTVTFYDFQLESGSAATSWVPYANVCPITGHTGMELTNTGKNCVKFTAVTRTLNGVTMTVNAETGEVSLNGTATAQTIFEVGTIDLLKPGVNYILTGCPSGGGANTYRLAVPEPYWTYDDGAGRDFVHYKPVSTRSVRLIVQQGVSVENLVFKPMIRLAAETDNTFEKAANSVYNTVFGETIYSGRLDLVKGELTSDMAYEQMTYSYLSGLSSDYIDYVYTEANGNEIWVRNWNYDKAVPRRIGGIKAASNMFRITSMHDTNRSASQNRIYFKVGQIDNVADFLQAVYDAEQNGGGLFVAYELAEPITYRLTPQQIEMFKGINSISANTGDVEVEYKVDLASYIEELKSNSESLTSISPLSLGKSATPESMADEPIEESKEADDLTVKKEISEELAKTEKVEDIKDTEEHESEVEV